MEQPGAAELIHGIVRAYIAVRRKEIRIEAGRRAGRGVHRAEPPAGRRGEGGLRGCDGRLAGEQVRRYLFSLRQSFSVAWSTGPTLAFEPTAWSTFVVGEEADTL